MSIVRFFTKTFTLQRQTWVDDGSSLETVATFIGHIQQAGPSVFQQYQGLRLNKTWFIWCLPSVDVKEGDRIVYDSNTYDVRFIENRNVGNQGHLHIIVEEHV